MVLTRLEVKRFKRLVEFSADFAPGLNLIRGPNESGKSTLRAALTAALFANPTSASDTVDRWTSWGQTKRCELKLDYLDGAGRPCQLRKDFANREIFLVRGDESFRTWKTIQAQLLEDLGLASEDLFMLCSSLDVRSLGQLGAPASRKEVGKMLASLMTGSESGQDVLTAIRKLDEALRELSKGINSASKTPGALKTARESATRLLAERARLEQDLALRRGREADAAALHALLQQTASRAQDLDRLLAANRKLAEARKRKEELAAQDDRFEQAAIRRRQLEADVQLARLQATASPAAGFTPEEINQVRALVEALRAPTAEAPAAAGGPNAWVWYAGAAAAFGLSWLIGGIPWGAVVGLVLAGVCVFTGWKAQLAARQASADRLAAQAGADLTRRERGEALARLMARAGGLTAEELLARWPEAQPLTARLSALEKQLQDTPPSDENAWKNLRRELRLCEDTLSDPELLALALSPVDLAGRERERQALDAARQDASGKLSRLQGILDHDAASQDRLCEAEENLAVSRDKIAWLEDRDRIGQIALDFLNRARKDTLNPARQILEERGGALLEIFSGGRYRKLSVDDEDLSCKIYLPETNRWEDPAVLSQGAFDQFYLGLRLALSEALTGGRATPFFLDEPLAAFDPERMARTMAWLKQASDKRQILFFTCRPEYDAAADRIIELKKPD